MSQNEDTLAALVLAQQRALETVENRCQNLRAAYNGCYEIYDSLVESLCECENRPFQCHECSRWTQNYHFVDPLILCAVCATNTEFQK